MYILMVQTEAENYEIRAESVNLEKNVWAAYNAEVIRKSGTIEMSYVKVSVLDVFLTGEIASQVKQSDVSRYPEEWLGL